MNPRTLSIAIVLGATTVVAGEGRAATLSAADCALLYTEYGVTPPGCAAPKPAPTVRSAAIALPSVVAQPVPQLTDKIRENHVFFPNGGTALSDEARTKLIGLIALLNGPRLIGACVKLVGHSDRSGSAGANLELSAQRAQTVAAFLSAALGTLRIAEIEGAGFDQPLKDFSPEARENRRVAIYLGPCPATRAP